MRRGAGRVNISASSYRSAGRVVGGSAETMFQANAVVATHTRTFIAPDRIRGPDSCFNLFIIAVSY